MAAPVAALGLRAAGSAPRPRQRSGGGDAALALGGDDVTPARAAVGGGALRRAGYDGGGARPTEPSRNRSRLRHLGALHVGVGEEEWGPRGCRGKFF
ncbi:hypothetical protein E2562_011325 [Oryza meyeriana var. granulata]|uniref:Uncharacterized protein n=1 Tax=Oryza meyeriana var. granulata TaxID=110450 RepID=A0A6G1BW71_9ORYZ|nr:hypothetical protein E2562_011325 [Oryza meyeriana var. granulata]